MDGKLTKNQRVFEIMLIIVILGMTTLFAQMGAYRAIVLHLFFLPIILSGYFLGRTSAGVLALFCALCVTIAAILVPTALAAFNTAVMVGLALTVWGAVLGLTALLAGTLCDERATSLHELHKAYVGVVEVLSRYLQGGNPHTKARSVRVAELSQLVAEELGLPRKQIDDIRVAALLHDLGNVEITTQVISRAFSSLEAQHARHTFTGTELVHSLGSVLEGALPLLAGQDDAVRDCLGDAGGIGETPLGAQIIRVARAYDDARAHLAGAGADVHARVMQQLRGSAVLGHDRRVLEALDRAGGRGTAPEAPASARAPALSR